MSSLIERLKVTSPIKKPTYTGKLGPGSVILPLASTVQSVASRPPVPGLMATFSIHVSENFTDNELRDLVHWVGNMPKSKSATLSLEGIKKTNSFLFLFQAPLSSFYRVMGSPDISLICENENISFDHILHPPPLRQRHAPLGLALRGRNPNVPDENAKPWPTYPVTRRKLHGPLPTSAICSALSSCSTGCGASHSISMPVLTIISTCGSKSIMGISTRQPWSSCSACPFVSSSSAHITPTTTSCISLVQPAVTSHCLICCFRETSAQTHGH